MPVLCLAAAAALAECPPEEARAVRVGAATYTVEVAANDAARERGLSGRSSLAPGTGMWFVLAEPSRPGFWMRDMRFPIDLVWIDPQGLVLDAVTLPLCEREPCPIIYPATEVGYVLEIAAGAFASEVGDLVEWRCD
jgi:hypothetical protein